MHALSARLFALATVFLTVVANPLPQDDPPQPAHPPMDKVYIKNVNYAGSGCPAGSVAPTIASDGSFLNVAFDSYTAEVYPPVDGNPGSKPADSRKNCQLTFELQYPPGWSLTVFDTTYFGYIKLDKKVTATQRSTYRWGGQTPTATFFSNWVGVKDENYSFTDSLAKGAYVWSSCTGVPGTLVVNTEIKVENSKNKKGSGLITTDSIEGKVIHKYGWYWKLC
ncbi:hypothetical protein EV426DRAFT_603570 [Tirmania nivea]|nr:hypothetical protein EV426DRAFT_603570 [Tirmania nivea]